MTFKSSLVVISPLLHFAASKEMSKISRLCCVPVLGVVLIVIVLVVE